MNDIEIADLNRDGRPDVVAAGYALAAAGTCADGVVGVLNVFITRPGGELQLERSFEFERGIEDIALGDFDGDGSYDEACADMTGSPCDFDDTAATIRVAFGIDGLSSRPTAVFDPGFAVLGSRERCVRAAELGGDPGDEFVVATDGAEIAAYGVSDSGDIIPLQTVAQGFLEGSIALADVVGDSTPDIIASDSVADETLIFEGLGVSGDADVFDLVPQTRNSGFRDVAAADFDADGDDDLVAIRLNQPTYRYLRNDEGDAFWNISYGLGHNLGRRVMPIDFDRNGYVDLLYSRYDASIGVERVQLVLNDLAPPGVADKQRISLPGAYGDRALAVADLTGDGVPEILSDAYTDGLSVTLGRAVEDPAFAYGPPGIDAPTRILHVLAVDLNADGLDDFVGSALSSVALYTSDGQGGVTASGTSFLASGFRSVAPDLDGDGSPEVCVAYRDGVLTVLPGGNIFDAPIQIPISAETLYGVDAGDIDGDGYDEPVVTGDSCSCVYVVDNNEGVLGVSAQQVAAPSTSFLVAVGDLTGDGLADAVTTDRISGDALVFIADPEMGLVFDRVLDVGGGAYWVTMGDLNADGHTDVAFGNRGTGTVKAFLGDGEGGLAQSWSDSVDHTLDLWEVDVGDANADGHLDLLVTTGEYITEKPSDVYVYHGAGDGTFTQAARVSLPDPNGAVFCDYNGDGVTDIAASTLGGNDEITLIQGLDLPAPCTVDIDLDGDVNVSDIDVFVAYFLDVYPANADIDADGDEDIDDIGAFVDAFIAGCG